VLILKISNAMKVRVFNPALPITIAIILSLSGCSSSTDTTVGPMTGRISGQALLYNMNCALEKASSGINVELLGIGFHTTTNDTGYWTFYQVPAGYYVIHFSKPGYTELFQDYIDFVGAGTLYLHSPFNLGKLTNWRLTLDTSNVTTQFIDNDLAWRIRFPFQLVDSVGDSIVSNWEINLFAGHSPNIDYRDTTSWFYYSTSTVNLSRDYYHLHSGDTIYVVGYAGGCVSGRSNYYFGRNRFYYFRGLGRRSDPIQIILP
jgi:hypothetical protein